MYIQPNDEHKIQRYLNEEKQAGNTWVTFDSEAPLIPGWTLKGHKSDYQASRLTEMEPGYRYVPIEFMLKIMAIYPKDLPGLNPKLVEPIINTLPFVFEQRFYGDDHILSLAKGESVPGQLAREHLRPADDIDKYVIIRHTHPGHMIYEQGHELSRKGEFSSLEEGLANLEKIVSDAFANKQNTRQFEVIELMGQFRDKSLQLSYDGIPQNNTGFVISHFYNEHGAKEPVIKSEHHPDQPITLYERLHLQLEFGDKGQIRLHVRDGLFKDVDLERGFGIKNPWSGILDIQTEGEKQYAFEKQKGQGNGDENVDRSRAQIKRSSEGPDGNSLGRARRK